MRWTLNEESKPRLFIVVAVRYLGNMGQIVQREGFWTGYGWRVVGEKYRVPFSVMEWSYLASDL